MTIIDTTDQMGLLSLQGPASRDILQRLTDTDLSDASFPFSTSQLIQVTDESLIFSRGKTRSCTAQCCRTNFIFPQQVGGHSVRALRLTFVGELGWELHVPFESMVDVYQQLMNVGQEFGIANAGYRAIDSLSIEKGKR